ncbi:MAG TPA: redoxin domain-containing protein [Verrucomicrobiae bacterium]|nr:redoxin domain-containing protein [Verrucomicrobiae bacterium]
MRKFAGRILLLLLVFTTTAFGQVTDQLKVQPEILKPGDCGIGRLIPDVSFKDIHGARWKLSSFKKNKALVIVMISDYCPVSNKLGPELRRLEKDYAPRGIAFLFLCPVSAENYQDVSNYASQYQLKSTVARDDVGLAKLIGATTTTESFVLDPARTLVYRGAVNDQYGLGYSKEAPTKNYLRDALDAILQNQPPQIRATTAPGCNLDLAAPTNTAPINLTYYNQISRILQANCVECHRKDGIGPFSLETYQDIIENAGAVRQQINRGTMPPWFAANSKDADGKNLWVNDRSLSSRDKADLLTWLASDRPKGNPADAPVPRNFSGKWNIGKPDVIYQIPEPVAVKAEGIMPYQNQTVQTSFLEDKWVQGYQILPSSPAVVHHVIVSIESDADPDEKGEMGATGYWAAYVPGYSYQIYPPGFARLLPAGAKLHFQIHYTPNGRATTDRMKIGLIFAKEPPKYEIRVLGIPQLHLDIPPGVHRHVEFADHKVAENMNILGYQAHTHLRGKSFKYQLIHPDGNIETLLDIPHYDFNWQLQYDYARPKFVSAGSTLRVEAVFDNSEDNPANPDPTKEVKWGLQTDDEMLIGYIEYYVSRSAGTPTSPLTKK